MEVLNVVDATFLDSDKADLLAVKQPEPAVSKVCFISVKTVNERPWVNFTSILSLLLGLLVCILQDNERISMFADASY